jgi:hypothetical protein
MLDLITCPDEYLKHKALASGHTQKACRYILGDSGR